MCFRISDKKVKVVQVDITSYKFVTIYSWDIDTKLGEAWYNNDVPHYNPLSAVKLLPFHAYNRAFYYELGQVHRIPPGEDSIFRGKVAGANIRGYHVNGGAFHSRKFIWNNSFSYGKFEFSDHFNVRVKCTIPKGSLYLENFGEYVSDRIRIDYISVEAKDWQNNIKDLRKFKALCSRKTSKLQLI